VAKELVK